MIDEFAQAGQGGSPSMQATSETVRATWHGFIESPLSKGLLPGLWRVNTVGVDGVGFAMMDRCWWNGRVSKKSLPMKKCGQRVT